MDSTVHLDQLHREAINRAKVVFAQLPHGNELFQQCIGDQVTIDTVLATLRDKAAAHRRKKSTKILDGFHRYTSWMMNISGSIDVAVNSSAGIACPVWASIKFVLMVSQDNSTAINKILSVVAMIADNLPRLDLYAQFHDDPRFQVALVGLFIDVTEFSVKAYRFLTRRTSARLGLLVGRSFDDEFSSIISDIKRRTKNVDGTAVALHQQRMEAHVLDTRTQQRLKDRIQAIQWLQSTNMREHHNRNVTSLADGTCEWLRSHSTFSTWCSQRSNTSKDKVLIIHGRAGCGKTILSSYIYDLLGEVRSPESPQPSTQLLFSFSSADKDRQTPATLFRSLLAQLLDRDEKDSVLPEVQALMRKSSCSNADLLASLGQALQSFQAPATLIIDGIDECSVSTDDLLQQLLSLPKQDPRLRIVILGQSHSFSQLLTTSLDVSVIAIKPDLTRADICTVIEKYLEQSPILSDSSIRKTVLQALLAKADGMFLWVRLMIDHLKTASCHAEVHQYLKELPEGLDQTYSLLLDRLHACHPINSRRLAQRLLSIIVACGRPLNYQELQSIYTHSLCIKSDQSRAASGNFVLRLPPNEILDICGGLLILIDGSFHLVHNSAREFLIRPADEWADGSTVKRAIFHVPLAESHELLSNVCLRVLRQAPIMQDASDRETGIEQDLSPRTLTRYACFYAAYHINESGEERCHLETTCSELFQSENYFEALEILLDDPAEENIEPMQENLRLLGRLGQAFGQRARTMPTTQTEIASAQELESQLPPPSETHRMGVLYIDTMSAGLSQTRQLDSHVSPTEASPRPTTFLLSRNGPPSRQEGPPYTVGLSSQLQNESEVLTNSTSLRRLNMTGMNGPGRNSLIMANEYFKDSLGLIRALFFGKSLLDPLVTFWKRILELSVSMPPIHMAAITWYLYQRKDYDKAIEIGDRCSSKWGNTDSFLQMIHNCFMGHMLHIKGQDRRAIEYLESARSISLTPIRKRFWEKSLDDFWLILLANCYRATDQPQKALDILYPLEHEKLGIFSLLGKMHLVYTLGQCEYELRRWEAATTHHERVQRLYKEYSSSTGATDWADYPQLLYLNSLRTLIHCDFELHRDQEAILLIKELQDLHNLHGPTLNAEEQRLFRLACSDVDMFQFIASYESSNRHGIEGFIRQKCDLDGPDVCRELYIKYCGTLDLFPTGITSERVTIFIKRYVDAYESAHSCTGEDCPSDEGHALHMADASILRYPLTEYLGFSPEKNASVSWKWVQDLSKHFQEPGTRGSHHLCERIYLVVSDLSTELLKTGRMPNLLVATLAARVASHFLDYLAPDEDLINDGKCCKTLCQPLRAQKSLLSAEEPEATAHIQDRVNTLLRLQTILIERKRLEKMYAPTEALVLPEMWSSIKRQYLQGYESSLAPHWRELV